LFVGLGLMAGLLYYSNPAAVAASLRGAVPAWLLLAIAVVIVDRVANAYRWLLLLRAIEPGRHIALGAAIRVFFVSGFIGSFLPGSVGGDAVRTLALSRLQVPPADAFASVVVDRMLGVASVLLMAAGSLLIVGRLFDSGTLAAMWISVGAFLLIFLLLLFDSRVLTGATTWVLGRRFPALHRVLSRALTAIRQYGRHRQTLVVVLGLSIGVQVLRTLQAWTLGQALGIEAGLVWYFAFLPVIILVMLLPTSVAGLGTGALAFQLLFGTIGVPPAASFALAVLFSALSIVGALPGGLMLAFERRPLQRADDSRAQRERFR
jgi:uncharacterized protein (TIRG00374 family)